MHPNKLFKAAVGQLDITYLGQCADRMIHFIQHHIMYVAQVARQEKCKTLATAVFEHSVSACPAGQNELHATGGFAFPDQIAASRDRSRWSIDETPQPGLFLGRECGEVSEPLYERVFAIDIGSIFHRCSDHFASLRLW